MTTNVFFLVLLFCFESTVAQKGLQCFVPGECLDSQILGAKPTNNSRDCWRHCQNVTGCTWFTFYQDSQICTPLSGCLRLTNEKCQDNCISGEEECPEVQCGVNGRCFGALEGIRKVGSAKECGSICEKHQECFWNTYDPEHESCLLTNDCPLLDRSCTNCSASERNCDEETGISEQSVVNRTLIGFNFLLELQTFNMETIFLKKCNLKFAFEKRENFKGQASLIGNQLHVCGNIYRTSYAWLYCYVFDIEKGTWRRTITREAFANSVYYYFNFPDGSIGILSQSKNFYIYDGVTTYDYRIENLATNDPKLPFCRTAISNEEFLFGFGPQEAFTKNEDGTSQQIFAFNRETATLTNITIKLQGYRLANSLCGAFGPKGNRKVAIFGGKQIYDNASSKDFQETLILDWKSKAIIDYHGPNLRAVKPHLGDVQTAGYGDTFLIYCTHQGADYWTNIYKFDINGTETYDPYVAEIANGFQNLAVSPTDQIPGCD